MAFLLPLPQHTSHSIARSGYESCTWFAIFGPKGLDPAVARKFNTEIKVALDDPETQKSSPSSATRRATRRSSGIAKR
jgi:tripartite-type tricarboxylate transporter receptor subunit TctC